MVAELRLARGMAASGGVIGPTIDVGIAACRIAYVATHLIAVQLRTMASVLEPVCHNCDLWDAATEFNSLP